MSEEKKEAASHKQTEQAAVDQTESNKLEQSESADQTVASAGNAEQTKPVEQTAESAQKSEQVDQAEPTAKEASQASQAVRTDGKPAAEKPALSDEEKASRLKAREERLAKAKAAKQAEDGEAAEEAAKEPSPNQPLLDKLVKLIQEEIASDAVEESMINELDGHMPTVVIKGEYWAQTASLLKDHDNLKLNYLINLSGVDLETHMEVVYHLESFETNEQYCVKVRTDRDAPSIPSVTPVWETANWPEREVYDLLGIQFPGHPDLRRIMMPDDWVGHPLRKDYEPLDPEV